MNKDQAAIFLGVSVRTLQRLIKRGEIAVRYERGHKGDEAHFDEDELRAYLERSRPASIMRPGASSALAPFAMTGATDAMTLAATNGTTSDAPRRMLAAFETLSVGNKLLLNLKEVRALTGLSENYLRDEIHAGRLKAKILGRGWKIKKSDLEAFVRKL